MRDDSELLNPAPSRLTHSNVRRTTVAYLCEFPTLLGGERSLLTFLAACDAASVLPIVAAPGKGRLADALKERGYPQVAWPNEGRKAFDKVAEALEPHRVDVIHANSLMTADAAVALGDRLKRPAVCHVRDIMTLSAARRDRLNELAALIAVSDAVADWLREIGIDPHRITRIYNAIDVAAIRREASPGAFRRELQRLAESPTKVGVPRAACPPVAPRNRTRRARDDSAPRVGNETPLVGCIGQIALRKGQDLFLDAAARLARVIPDVHFVVVGERYSQKQESRAFEAALHACAAKPPLAGRTHFLGYREDVPSILSDLDVVVVPSRQEPLSRVLLEALALEVPAIATAVGGSPEILAGGEAGLLVPPEGPDRMAEAIQSLLTDDTLRPSLTTVGLRRAQELFAPEAQASSLGDVYRPIAS